MTQSPFGPALVRFLRELRDNNKRAWFESNRDRYERDVREPALAFVRVMTPYLETISPYLLADDRKAGGSMMRIHRDVRFSKSKLPYKTNLGIQFRHESGRDVHAPGLYFHVDPDSSFLAAGMWHPDSESLAAVRRAIAEEPGKWRRVRDGKRFRETWELSGESLKSAPRGYPADHPMIEDLKRKDHIAVCRLRKTDLSHKDFVREVAQRYRKAKAYLAWQAAAIGLPL